MSTAARGWTGPLLAAPAALLITIALLMPLAVLARVSLYEGGGSSGFGIGGGMYKPGTWSVQAYRKLAGDRYARDVVGFTVKLGLAVACVSLALGYPLALGIWPLQGRMRALAILAVILPKLCNVLVTIYGLELILSDTGPLNRAFAWMHLTSEPVPLLHNLTGVMIGKTYLILPYVVLIVLAALDRMDPALIAAARGLGAGPVAVFYRVILPLSRDGIALAGLVAFIWGMGAFASPYLMGSPDQITLAVDIQKQAFENLNWPRAGAEAIVMLVTLAICTGLYERVTRVRG